jgi:hypothetical protein
VVGVSAELSADGSAFDVAVDFQPIMARGHPYYRPPELLVRLAAKLHEVEWAELKGVPGSKFPPEPGPNGSGQEAPKGDPVERADA